MGRPLEYPYFRIWDFVEKKYPILKQKEFKDSNFVGNLFSDVVGEQKLGSGRVQGLLFGFRSGSGINISGMSPWSFRGFVDF